MTDTTSWRDHRVLIFHGSRDTNRHDLLERDYQTRTLREIFAMEPGANLKNDSLAMIPSTYAGFDGRTHAVQKEKGLFVALTADIDEGNHSFVDIELAVQSLFGGTIDCRIYSSSSATEMDKRWRIIAPLLEPMRFDEWNLWQRALYAHLEEKLGTPVDWSLARAAQPVYLPNVPPVGRHPDGKPIYYANQVLLGETISSDNAAAFIAVERLRQADIEETQKAEQARQEALARQRERQSEPAYTRNIIEAYNAAHDIEELMQANGYIAGRSHNWRSPYQSGKSFATKVFGDYWVSLSDSDATAAIGRKCTSGRFGDAFDIYCHFEHGGDIAKALSQAALKLGMDNAHSQKPTKYTDTSQPHWETTKHPLAAYVEAECEQFVQEEFVLDGLLVAGAVLLAGAWGAGKTTQLVPLMCRAAHLCQSNDPLRPLLRRRVVYVTEDIEQVRRILRSMRLAGEFEGISREEVSDWFKLVQAVRMKPADIVTVAGEYAKLATDNVNDTNGRSHVAQAVVVLDTRSAVIAIDDENDNSEASAAIATFRQGMPTNPLVIVGHLAKTLTKSDVKSLSARGAGAWEADVQQVLYLCKEDEVRWLDVSTPKHRFISQVDGVEFQTHRTVAGGIDPLGNPVDIPLIHGVPTLVGLGQRQKTQAEQAELARKNRVTSLRREVLGAVTTAHYSGNHMNRQALKSKSKAKHADALDMLETLMQERWIAEIEIPKEQRTHPARKHHLIPLNEAQRRIWLETASPPDFTSRPTSESQTIPPVARHKNEIQTNEVLE